MNEQELKDLLERIAKLDNDFKAYREKADKEQKQGGITPETKEALDKISADLNEAVDKKAEHDAKVKERLDALEVKVNRGDLPGSVVDEQKRNEERKAFFTYLRGKGPMPESLKALTTTNDARAGYLNTPSEFEMEILKEVTELSPFRQLATVRQTSGMSVKQRKRTAVGVASWTAEGGTRTEDESLSYDMIELYNHEMTFLVKVTQEDLEDSAYNLEQVLTEEYTEAFATLENAAFSGGDGVGKPSGFLTDTDVIAGATNSGSAATVLDAAGGVNGPIAAQDKLAQPYQAGAVWLMQSATRTVLRQAKDSTGNYLYITSLVAGVPDTFLGKPVVICPDMPAIAADAYSMAYANMKQAYKIVDRVGMQIQRLNELYAATGMVGFLGRRRVGGMTIRPDAIKLVKCST